MGNNKELIAQCEERAKLWLTPAFDEETRKEVQAMLTTKISRHLSTLSIRTWNSVQVVCVVLWAQVQTV